MELNFKEIITAFMVLFAVIDIIGNIPIIIDLRSKNKTIQSGKASLIALMVMVVFMFIGEDILGYRLMSTLLPLQALSFCYLLPLKWLGITLYRDGASNDITATVFPLAFPLIAG